MCCKYACARTCKAVLCPHKHTRSSMGRPPALSTRVRRFDIRRSKVLQDFDAATDNRGRPSGAKGAEEAEPEQEEDFVMGGGGQQELLNNRCPLTGKNVSVRGTGALWVQASWAAACCGAAGCEHLSVLNGARLCLHVMRSVGSTVVGISTLESWPPNGCSHCKPCLPPLPSPRARSKQALTGARPHPPRHECTGAGARASGGGPVWVHL